MTLSLKAQRLAVIATLLLWCSLLITVRIAHDGSNQFTFLWWNLLLAFIPLMLSTALASARQRRQRINQILWFCLWLLFLPNAPYILTDLIHLAPHPGVPLWYDLTLFLSCAGTGLFLGYVSLLDIQLIVEQRFGAKTGWAMVIGAMLLSGFGVYIGRFLRWNSWEALTNPLGLFYSLWGVSLGSSDGSNPLVVGTIFGIALTLGYAAMRALSVAGLQSGAAHE
jgi:uncharacterized membrane protein